MKRTLVIGILLVLLGGLLLLRSMGLIWFSTGDLFNILFALSLMGIGAWWIVRQRQQELLHQDVSPGTASARPGSGPSGAAAASAAESRQAPGDKLQFSRLFGDLLIDCNGENLHNVSVSCFLGDVTVLLSGGRLREGLNRLVVSGFLGDIHIVVPANMPVFVHTSNFGGDISVLGRHASGLGNTLDAQTPDYDTAPRRLYIAVSQFVGDIRVEIRP